MIYIFLFLLLFLILKWVIICALYLIPLLLLAIALTWGYKFYKMKHLAELMNELTSKEHLDKLNKEQKLELAMAIERSRKNNKAFIDYAKSSCTDFAIGWTVVDLGLVKSIRYGLGYTLLRKAFQGSLKKSKKD